MAETTISGGHRTSSTWQGQMVPPDYTTPPSHPPHSCYLDTSKPVNVNRSGGREGSHRSGSICQGQVVPDYTSPPPNRPPPSCYLDTSSSRCVPGEPVSTDSGRDPEWRTLLRTRLRNPAAEERPFKCRLCPRSFTQSSHLNRHCLSHTGQQPFKCRFCTKRFARSDNCRTHEKSHERAMGRL